MIICRFVIAVALLSCGVYCSNESVTEIGAYNCMEEYLSANNMLDRGFRNKKRCNRKKSESDKSESEAAVNGTSQCETHLSEYRDLFYSELTSELKADDEFETTAECIVDQAKKLHLAEVAMKRHVYENTRKMSRRKRKKSLRAIDYAIEKKMEVAVKLCTTDEVFGELFDSLYASGSADNATESSTENNIGSVSSEEDSDAGEDYCTRKYMIDNNFINTTVYDVKLNPEKVDVANLKCENVVEALKLQSLHEIKEEFEEEGRRPSKKTNKCIVKAMNTGNYFENSIKVVMLGEMKVADDLKAEERKKFVEAMKEMYDAILKC